MLECVDMVSKIAKEAVSVVRFCNMQKTLTMIFAYNVKKHLRQCFYSVYVLTFPNWECICADDGATDSSPVMLDEYLAKEAA